MLSKIIRNYIAKVVAGRSDDGIMITLKDPKKVEFQAAMLEDLLMRNGIDPKLIKSEQQLKNILNQIDASKKQSTTTSGIRNTESAKVFDLEGNKLDPNKPIMGGKQEGMFDNIFNKMQNERKGLKTVDDDLPPPGSRGGDDDIAAPVQSQEETLRNMTEAEIKKEIEAQNKSSIQKILERKNREDVYSLDDYDTTNMSEIKKQIIRLETRLGNLNPELPGFRDRARVLVDEIENLKNKTRDDKADGGRIGLKDGLPNKLRKLYERMLKHDDQPTITDKSILRDLIEAIEGQGASPNYNVKEDLPREVEARNGGRIGFKGGLSKILKEFMERRKFLKTMVGNTEKNRKAMELEMLKETIENARKNPGFEFPSGQELRTEIEKKISPILLKDRKLNADGGIMRVGLKDGMNRRTFLKFLAGAASIPIIGKIFKPLKIGKTVTKVPIIKTADVAGKPEWFDQLVNKVILEGDDFTKKLATGERQVVHVKKLDEDTTVSVTQDMDNGVVRVEYDSPANTFEDTVQLQYKKPLPDEGSPNPAAEFEVAESGPIGRVQGPDDFDIDIDEVSGTSIRDLDSDVSKLKAYATGEKPTMKEFIQNKKRRDKAKAITEDLEAQSDAVIRRQGDYDPSDYDDYASGGIARMLGE